MRHTRVNFIPKAAKARHTDRHNSFIAAKGSTLEGGEKCRQHARSHASLHAPDPSRKWFLTPLFSACYYGPHLASDRFGSEAAVQSREKTSIHSIAQPNPTRGVNQDSNNTVLLWPFGRLIYSILSGCFGAESVAGLSGIRKTRLNRHHWFGRITVLNAANHISNGLACTQISIGILIAQ